MSLPPTADSTATPLPTTPGRLETPADRGLDATGDTTTAQVSEGATTADEQDRDPRRVVFVVGSGRSGTSTMSGALRALGLHVPQPEVVPDDTNPRGFGEPQWAVEFHTELLKRVGVQVSDARPDAWFEAGRAATNEGLRERLYTWLDAQFADLGPELVVKDPRLSWFAGLWRSAALRCGATPGYVTMLRPVTEVVGSKQRYYGRSFGEISRTAGWVNMMLHTERATRGSRRAFVRYSDMLKDWTVPVAALGEQFDLHGVRSASANDIRIVHNFIDPTLRRVQLTWDDITVPSRLREIADETWRQLDRLPEPGNDGPPVHAALDELRAAYADYYAEAEAVTESSALAARREGMAQQQAQQLAQQRARSAKAPAPPPPSRADRIAGRVPHGVRAAIPPRARRAFRRAMGR